MGGGGALDPVAVEQRVDSIVDRIERGITVVTQLEAEAEALERQYDREYASAYLKASAPQTEKKYHAELATAQLRADKEIARMKFKHAQRQLKALESRLSAVQTIAKSVTAAYAGTRAR